MDHDAAVKILNKFSSLNDQIVDEFISKSQVLTKKFSKKCLSPVPLGEHDPICQAGKWHEIIYELPADTQAYAYKNIGSSEFQAVRFEFKN